MALADGDFKQVGSNANNLDGGQVYSVRSTTDTMATMMAASYLDNLNGTLNSNDIVIISGTDGVQLARIVNTSGVITLLLVASDAGVHQALSGAGAADLLTAVTNHTSTGADVVTLANGTFVGQKKIITCAVDGGSSIITPATTLGAWSTCTLLNVGDTIQLLWNGTGWLAIGVGAGTVNLPVFA